MDDPALLIIDMQLGNFLEPHPIYKGGELLSRVESLINKARIARIPVIYVQHNGGCGDPDEYGTNGWQIHPSLKPVKGDILIQKESPDSFYRTRLRHELESKGIKTLVIAGLQTEYCIDTTCRQAYSIGYDTILVSDAHSTWDSQSLTAEQVIQHHNQVLGGWFATLKKEEDVVF